MSDISLKQNWEIQVIGSNSIFPFIVIDNWYTPNEEKAVWIELDHYCSTPKDNIDRAENTVVAKDKDGNSKSRAYRFYISSVYTEKSQHFSPIINCMYKQRTPAFHNVMKECMPYARSFLSSNSEDQCKWSSKFSRLRSATVFCILLALNLKLDGVYIPSFNK